jgi:creatinine amidohydrolase/Fe(II)-dependent formamide hydrolase-like protein
MGAIGWPALIALAALGWMGPAMAVGPQLEEMTWPEVRDAVRAGKTTVIIPVGGTEQNGPHMTLGKHNARVKVLAERIANELGNALVAPVISYVPDGRISPPTEHMRFAGTISIPDDAFVAMIDGAARSFAQHGFTDVVLIGDHGGYQDLLAEVASKFNHRAAASPARVHFISGYYKAGRDPYRQLLRNNGLTDAQIGDHAGARDTSEELATVPGMVRPKQLTITAGAAGWNALGVTGDPGPSTAALGQLGVDLIVSRSVQEIRKAVDRAH